MNISASNLNSIAAKTYSNASQPAPIAAPQSNGTAAATVEISKAAQQVAANPSGHSARPDNIIWGNGPRGK